MKKIMILAILFFATRLAEANAQLLDKAVREHNSNLVGKLLTEKKLTSKEAIVLYSLADEMVQIKKMADIRYNFAHGISGLLGCYVAFGGIMGFANLVLKGDSLFFEKFALLSCIGLGLASGRSLRKVLKRSDSTLEKTNKQYDDVLTIKGLILEQIDLADIKALKLL